MSTLTPRQLEQARRYIESCGSAKNPISLLNEIGQQLHQTPSFKTHESSDSSVHQHIFVCDVTFLNYNIQATGYNKKQIKTEAARMMIDRILQGDNLGSSKGITQKHTATVLEQRPSTQTSLNQLPGGTTSVKSRGVFTSINTKADNWQKPHTKDPQTSSSEMVRMVNSRLGLRALNYHLDQICKKQASEASDNSTKYDKNYKERFSTPLRSDSPGIDNDLTALERLKELSRKENFAFVFHDLESNDSIHLCLVEAKLRSNFVCHGKGENKPQAREDAAENLLFIVNFFMEKS